MWWDTIVPGAAVRATTMKGARTLPASTVREGRRTPARVTPSSPSGPAPAPVRVRVAVRC